MNKYCVLYFVICFIVSFAFSLIFNNAIIIFICAFCLLTLFIKDKLFYKTKSKNKTTYNNINFNKIKTIENVDNLTHREFEFFISHIYNKLGYKTMVTKSSGDYGVDVICEKHNKTICIQAKKYTSTVGVKSVQEIYAGLKFYNGDVGIVITTAPDFSRQAKRLAKATNITLINRQKLEELIKSIR